MNVSARAGHLRSPFARVCQKSEEMYITLHVKIYHGEHGGGAEDTEKILFRLDEFLQNFYTPPVDCTVRQSLDETGAV